MRCSECILNEYFPFQGDRVFANIYPQVHVFPHVLSPAHQVEVPDEERPNEEVH